jgi:hypothetical protein
MSPWLYNIFIDGVVREVNARVMERGASLMSDSGGGWQVNQIIIHLTQYQQQMKSVSCRG